MNICLLSPTFLPKIGGAEIVVDSLARHLTQMGHNAIVITQWPRKGKGLPNDDTFTYPVVRYKRPWSFTLPLGMRSIYTALANAHKKYNFDIIHCHLVYPSGYIATKFARKTNIPVIITAHGSDIRPTSRYRKKKIIWRRIIFSLDNANHITAISSHMKNIIEQITKNPRQTFIPNGVDVEEFGTPVKYEPDWPIKLNMNFILYIGSLKHIKGPDILLRAMTIIRDNSPETFDSLTLIIAGKGPLAEQLKQYVEKNNLVGKIYFTGEVTGSLKKYLLQNARFVVLPSRSEAMPLVPLEAFASHTPVIASAVGGLINTIEDGKTGKLIPPESPESLANAIIELWNSDCSQMRKNAVEKAKFYDWKNITKQYIMLYENVINAK